MRGPTRHARERGKLRRDFVAQRFASPQRYLGHTGRNLGRSGRRERVGKSRAHAIANAVSGRSTDCVASPNTPLPGAALRLRPLRRL